MSGSSDERPSLLARARRWVDGLARLGQPTIVRMPIDDGGGGGDPGGGGGGAPGGSGSISSVFFGPTGPIFGQELPFSAFETVATVYACVTKISQALAMTPLKFYVGEGEGRKEIPRRPGNIVDLWSKANSRFSDFELVEQIQASLDLDGNAFVLIETAGGFVTGFATMPPQFVTVKVNKSGQVIAYVLNANGVDMVFPPELVIHIKYFTARWMARGMSPLAAGNEAWQTVGYATQFTKDLFKRGGEGISYFETDTALDESALTRLERKLAMRYTNPAFRNRPVALPKGMKRVNATMSAADLKAVETKLDSKLEILEVFGVPPWKLGIKVGGSLIGGGSGAEVDERMWVTDTLMPRAVRIQKAITEFLLMRFFANIGELVTCEFDFSTHPAMVAWFLSQAKGVAEVVNKVITTNEGRHFLKLTPLPGEEFDTITSPQPVDQQQQDQQQQDAPKKAQLRAFMRRRHSRSLRRFERRVERMVLMQMSRQQSTILGELGARSVARQLDPQQLAEIIAQLEGQEAEEWQQMLWHILQERGEEALAALGSDVDLRLNQLQWDAWVRTQVERALLATETTKRMLRESIADALANGASTDEVIATVRQVFNDRRDNALTIARTETQPAYNAATLEAATQSGVVQGKAWVAVHDDVVRPAHLEAEANGVIPLDQPFYVDNEPLMYPGDPHGRPENTINCRCGVEYEVMTERGVVKMDPKRLLREVASAERRRKVGEQWLTAKR